MTWLDLGNGWRNLYLLSCLTQALALGALFCARGWFAKRSRLACFLTGATVTPFAQYLWTLLLALLWPGASKWVYIGVPPALACLCLLVLLLRRLRRLKALLSRGWAFVLRVCRMDKPALISLCAVLCLAALLLPACVRLCSSMTSASGGDAGEYMALGLRYCEDRDLGKLLEKEETEGHFRGHSHFPSLELYMSYALFHASGDDYGYPNDKPLFTGVGLLSFYMAAAYLTLLLVVCGGRTRWALLGALLLNLVPSLVFSVTSAPRDIWRILALFWAACYFAGLEPRCVKPRCMKPQCGWARYAGKLAATFAVCFTVMSAHVVCFVVLPFIVLAWVVWRWLEALLAGSRDAGRTLLASVGLALSGAAGTVAAFLGNLWCYRRWGEMSPWRLMTTYTDAPWYGMYMRTEYKLEEATRHLSFWDSSKSILLSHETSIGDWGWRFSLLALLAAILLLIVRRARLRKAQRALRARMPADGASAAFVSSPSSPYLAACLTALYMALLTLFTLAPMTGLIDSPLYSFSGSFLKMQRYTLQWFMFAACMICCALSSLNALWPAALAYAKKRAGKLYGRLCAARRGRIAVALLKRAPAYLCALLCALGFVKGVGQTGYATNFYRYSRDIMEDGTLLLDNGFREQYATLRAVAAAVPEDQKILVTRAGYQYALDARGYVLTSNPIVPLLNLKLDEIEGALRDQNVAMLATEPDFWDERYFALSALSEYLNRLPPAQIVETERMRLYLIDPSLVASVPRD